MDYYTNVESFQNVQSVTRVDGREFLVWETSKGHFVPREVMGTGDSKEIGPLLHKEGWVLRSVKEAKEFALTL